MQVADGTECSNGEIVAINGKRGLDDWTTDAD